MFQTIISHVGKVDGTLESLCSVCIQRKGREINLCPSTHSSLSPIMFFQLQEVGGRHHKVFPSAIPAADGAANLL